MKRDSKGRFIKETPEVKLVLKERSKYNNIQVIDILIHKDCTNKIDEYKKVSLIDPSLFDDPSLRDINIHCRMQYRILHPAWGDYARPEYPGYHPATIELSGVAGRSALPAAKKLLASIKTQLSKSYEDEVFQEVIIIK